MSDRYKTKEFSKLASWLFAEFSIHILFSFYSLLEAELAFGNLLGFFWLVGGYEVNAGIYAFLNLLHLVDGPYIHLHTQVVTLFNPVRILRRAPP